MNKWQPWTTEDYVWAFTVTTVAVFWSLVGLVLGMYVR